MPRRIAVLALCAALLCGCGGKPGDQAADLSYPDPSATPAEVLDLTGAKAALGTLKDLAQAWREKDCGRVADLTTGVERTFSARACAAARNGAPGPGRIAYRDVEIFIPTGPDAGDWFVALSADPDPAYFLLERDQGRWRVAIGPVPLVAEPPELLAEQPAEDDPVAIAARLAPQRHLTFLTDRAGVSGVRFARGDPMHELRAELVGGPGRARADRVRTDLSLIPGPLRMLRIDEEEALVFHALRLERTQRAAGGRLRRPLYDADRLRAFTGTTRPAVLSGTEVLVLATRVSADGALATVAMRRGLADLTAADR